MLGSLICLLIIILTLYYFKWVVIGIIGLLYTWEAKHLIDRLGYIKAATFRAGFDFRLSQILRFFVLYGSINCLVTRVIAR